MGPSAPVSSMRILPGQHTTAINGSERSHCGENQGGDS